MRTFALLTVILTLAGCFPSSVVLRAPLEQVQKHVDQLYPDPKGMQFLQEQAIPAYRGNAAAYSVEVTRGYQSDGSYTLTIDQEEKFHHGTTTITLQKIDAQKTKVTVDAHQWNYLFLWDMTTRDPWAQGDRLSEIKEPFTATGAARRVGQGSSRQR